MPKIILYFTPGSPPARAVLLLLRELDIDVEIKTLDLMVKREQHSEEFLKLNPAHEVPTLVEGDFVLTESRAILGYLVNSRKPGNNLYPTEPKARAVVDQRLSYDHVLFAKFFLFIVSLFYFHANYNLILFLWLVASNFCWNANSFSPSQRCCGGNFESY